MTDIAGAFETTSQLTDAGQHQRTFIRHCNVSENKRVDDSTQAVITTTLLAVEQYVAAQRSTIKWCHTLRTPTSAGAGPTPFTSAEE